MFYESFGSLEEALERTKPAPLLCELLTAWVDTFDPDTRPNTELPALWAMLASGLCDRKNARLQPFLSEIYETRDTPRAGYPPVNAITQRIHELRECGLSPFFLITAIRIAMDQLVQGHLLPPEAIESWQRLADERLPVGLFFTVHASEMNIGTATFGPDIEDA